MASPRERTFLVEGYVPGLDERTAITLSSRLRGAIRQLGEEGVGLRWRGSFAVVDEETFLLLVSARRSDDAVRLSEQAGFAQDHVVEVLPIDAPATQPP